MMKKRGHKLQWIERFTDKIIPFLVIVIAFMLISQNPFWTLIDLSHYEPWVGMADIIILVFFLIDLYFKWKHVKNFKKFLKLYWFDVIAVFPFYLVTRTWFELSFFFTASEQVGGAQKLAHEAVLLRELKIAEELKWSEIMKELKLSKLFREVNSVERILKFFALDLHKTHHIMRHRMAQHRKA